MKETSATNYQTAVKGWGIAIIILLINFCISTYAQEPFVPDRPGFSTGTFTVKPGDIYLEIGYDHSFGKEIKSSALPVTNIRFGILQNFELFIGWDGWISHGNNFSNVELPSLGTKLGLLETESFNLTMLGLIPFSYESGSLSVEPALGLVWDYELSDRLELFGLCQGGYVDNTAELLFAVGLGIALNDRLDTFAEYYNMGYPSLSLLLHGSEYGFMFSISENIQVDVYGGYGFSPDVSHYFGMGISKRF